MSRAFGSSVIEASIECVWPVIRDFGQVQVWLPVVKSCHLERDRDPEFVGTIRALEMADGSLLRERLLALSDAENSVVFEIVESPLPISKYVSTILLTRVTDGHRTLISWTAEYEAKEATEIENLKRRFEQKVFQPGFEQLKRLLVLQP